jgi:hypothetical protein
MNSVVSYIYQINNNLQASKNGKSEEFFHLSRQVVPTEQMWNRFWEDLERLAGLEVPHFYREQTCTPPRQE